MKTPLIIGISGLIGSGKDTVADYLCNFHGFRKESWANSLKDAISAIFGWDRILLEGRTSEARIWREEVDTWWAKKLDLPKLTPRWILQYWGTDLCRYGFHDNIWIASLENKLSKTRDNIVISDCRFANEITAVKNNQGITARVIRGPAPSWYNDALDFNRGPVGNLHWALSRHNLESSNVHASEYSHIGLEYDYVIDNNSTVDELHTKVNDLLLDRQLAK